MNDREDVKRVVETYLESLETPAGERVDEKVLPAALTAMHKAKPQTALASRSIWRTIMTSKTGKLTAAAAVAVVVLFAVFDSFTKPAWALDQAIEALKDFRAVHVTGAFPGGTAEVWFRANETKTQSTDVVVRGSLGAITWTRDGSTYHYEPAQNTVYYENALTIGMSQWFSSDLLEMFRSAKNTQIIQGKDPATGRDRVMLMCSLVDVHGPQSWVMEFDADSKLPIAMKQWQNLDRSGPPSFDAFKIVYYEDLPNSVFDIHVPGDAKRVEKPLQIPEETVGILGNPQDGISIEGLTQQEAAGKIVRALYQAVISQDMNGLKSLSPLCRNWGDDFVRQIVFKPNRDDRIVEILEVGQILRTGQSSLGPIAAVPVTLKLKNGKKVQEQMIVQFRSMGGRFSCVVHGPYGIPREID